LVDQVLFESVDRLPDPARYQPTGRKAMLRRIDLRGLDPALFERPKSGFLLPFDRWIRRGLKGAIEQTLRDPQAIIPVGLEPAAVERLWRAFVDAAPVAGQECGLYSFSFGGAIAIAFSGEPTFRGRAPWLALT
jgi:asparagine synthase (glutamine-hydrolysing)